MRLDARRTTLEEFAWVLSLSVGRPVIDRTGIAGVFDALVEFTPDESDPRLPPPTSDEPATAPTLFTAIQEQLGLKLEAARGPGEFIVIDDVQRPSEN